MILKLNLGNPDFRYIGASNSYSITYTTYTTKEAQYFGILQLY